MNDLPVGNNESYAISVGENFTAGDADGTATPADSNDDGVLLNDTDEENDPLTAVLVTGPTDAAFFDLDPSGSFIYDHNGLGPGDDSFTYIPRDSQDGSLATVTITVNDPPVGTDDVYTVDENGTLTVDDADGTVTGGDPSDDGVLVNDSDTEGDPFTAILFSSSSNAAPGSSFAADGTLVYIHDGSEDPSDSFTYRPFDGSFGNVTTITIDINPINDAPVAAPDNYAIPEGGTLNANDANGSVGDASDDGVLANDNDAENDTLTAMLDTLPSHAASFALNGDGTFSYTHDGGEDLSDGFTYHANDTAENSAVVAVTISITPLNDTPQVVINTGKTVNEGSSGSIITSGELGSTDSDDTDSNLIYTVKIPPANGTLFSDGTSLGVDDTYLQGDIDANLINYTHNGSETLADSFEFTVSDDELPIAGEFPQTAFDFTITAVNDLPVAVDDAATLPEGGSFDSTVNLLDTAPGATSVLANDTDGEDHPLTAGLIDGPDHASSFTLNPNGSFTYTHNDSETTLDFFSYRVSDAEPGTVANVFITITPTNDPPDAAPDVYTVGEGGTLITTDVLGIGGTNDDSVLVNDPDLEEDILTAVLDSGPSNASSFSLNSNGTFTYQHNGSETTVDSFDYHANDGEFDSPTVTATINIVPSNDPPIGVDDNYSVLEGGTLNADDADGSVGDATDDGVLANDIDLEGNTLTAALVSGSSNGAPGTSLAPDGTFVYVHDGSETTFDTFTYRPSDIAPGSEATVNITVIPVNDPPVGMADTYTLPEGGTLTADDSIGSVGDSNNDGALANDSDVEGNPFTAVSFTAASNAGPATTFNSDGTFVYQHDGSETNSDSLTYRPQDTDPGIPTAINFIITPVNDAPTVAVNNGLTVAEGSLGNLISSLQLSATDSDDNDPDLVYTITGPPSEGTLFNNGTALTITDNFTQDDINANRLTYSHNDGENPTDSFAFIVIDDETPTPAESSQKFFPITISPDNDPPLGLPDAATLLEGGTFNSALNPLDVPAGGNSILDNDIDPEGDPLSALLISGPANDSAFALAANGTFTYSHNGSETTFDSFTYQPNDVIPGSVTSVSLTIVPQNDPPAAIDDGGAGFITNEDLLFATGDVLNNDSDSDIGDTITVLSFDTSDTMGVVSDNGDGTFFFDPDAQFDFLLPGDITTSTFTYTVEDTAEDTDTATVTITVTGINDQPALNTAQLSLGEGNTVVLNTNNLSASDADHDDSTLIFEASGVVGGQFEFTAAPGTPISTFTQLQISTGAVHFVDDGNEIAPTFDILVRDALNATFGPVPVAINFNFGNDPPTAFDDSSSSFTTNSDFPFTTGNVLANDTDPDPSDILSVQSFNSGATTGLVSDNGDGTFNYDPNGQFDFLLPGQSDSDTFAYTAQDPIGETDDATVTITINGVNDPPVSVADNHTLPEGGSLVAADLNGSVGDSNDDGVLANDSDPEGDAMSALLDSSPTHAASFTLNPNGSFDYSHDGGEDFSDSFTYHATDGSENGDVVIVSLAIQAVNDPPEVVNPT